MYDDIPLEIQGKKEPLPLISCVCLTVTPKRFHLLPDALRSYRQQTYSPRELLVINDGKPLVSRAPDVRVINLPDRGRRWSIGEKRNVGIREAHGEFLAVWDDDDVSLPSRLVEQMAVLLSYNADYVKADAGYVSDRNLKLIGNCTPRLYHSILASALARRSILVSVGGYGITSYGEDAQMLEAIRLVGRGHVVIIPNARWYVMRRHEVNVTLEAGERSEEYNACALKDPDVKQAEILIDIMRRGPGGNDIEILDDISREATNTEPEM